MGQLKDAGAEMAHFVDQVRDYMAMWDTKQKLIADIKKRGVVYQDFSATGTLMQKNNPSVKELVGVNRQMLMILKELGLSTSKVSATGDEDDDL